MRRPWVALSVTVALAAAGCGGTLDAGHDVPHGLLPVDERNPVILDNDGWSDNWSGEYAVLSANNGGPPLVGIIATASDFWKDIEANVTGWTNLVTAARSSGLENIPDVTMSTGAPLVKPSDGQIDSTTPNRSAGAHLIVDLSRRLSMPFRPVVVLAGTTLTDCADAYLIDHTVVDRVVVVAALGSYSAPNGVMGAPNGDLDLWSDWIVAQRFRYVQVSAYYDQTTDVTTAEISDLPRNSFGAWMAAKQPSILKYPSASDQVAVLSSGLPPFVLDVRPAVADTTSGFDSSNGLVLAPHDGGNIWVVNQIAAPLAGAHLWQWLLAPHPFAP